MTTNKQAGKSPVTARKKSLLTQLSDVATERDELRAELALYAGTLESRDRNIEMLADENRRLIAELAKLDAQEPVGYYCKSCRETGLSHCSDPVNCGVMQRTYLAAGAQNTENQE